MESNMNDYPTTIEEARTKRYNVWGGNPKGTRFVEGKCAGEIYRMHLFYQCSRTAKCGPWKLVLQDSRPICGSRDLKSKYGELGYREP